MRRKSVVFGVVLLAAIVNLASAAPPLILSLQTNRLLRWTSDLTNGIAIVQKSTSLPGGSWFPFFYDSILYSRTSSYPYPFYADVTLPSPRTTLLPISTQSAAFFRLALQTNVPDPSLLMHLSFDNDFRNSHMVLDSSGHNNHGLAYGRPGYPTNWPSITVGPDGSQAAEFHYYVDGWGDYHTSGDYIGIPSISDFTNLPQATIAFWCHYYGDPAGCNCNSTPIQAGMGTGAFMIGRLYDVQTTCEVEIDGGSTPIGVTFPDRAPNNDTGGWHHYAVTFDHGSMSAYFDGTNCSNGLLPVSALSVGGTYISIAGWTFNESPWMDNSVPSKHPNNAWINGAMDDVRIYNRVLSSSEMHDLYTSFDKEAPSTPQNVTARTDSGTQTEISWASSSDNFRVEGYRLRRNGAIIGNLTGTHYVDTGLTPQTTYSYTVQAYDPAGNFSPQSATITTNTPAAGGPIEVIVDDADGAPWSNIEGSWILETDPNNPPNPFGPSWLAGFSTRGAVSVTFRPSLPEAGNYQVYLWNPGAASYSMWIFSSLVPVDIVSGGATNITIVNEQINYASWNYLGTYSFSAGTNGFVRIRTDGTGGDVVSADAVRFVK